MHISLVTDELSSDMETAFELARECGIERVELRSYFGQRVPELDPYLHWRLRRLLAEYGMSVTAISPGLFKFPYPAEHRDFGSLDCLAQTAFHGWESLRAQRDHHLGPLLDSSIRFAHEVGAPFIVAFSFHRGGAASGPAPGAVTDALAEAAARVKREGLQLLVETEEGFWADTGVNSARIAQACREEGLGLNWDPANSFCDGDIPYPDGYAAVKEYVRNVHFKDARRLADARCEFVADGEVNWAGQIAALRADGYDGSIAIEPHLSPRIASVRHALERLRRFIEPTR